jgi:hypothetical protein
VSFGGFAGFAGFGAARVAGVAGAFLTDVEIVGLAHRTESTFALGTETNLVAVRMSSSSAAPALKSRPIPPRWRLEWPSTMSAFQAAASAVAAGAAQRTAEATIIRVRISAPLRIGGKQILIAHRARGEGERAEQACGAEKSEWLMLDTKKVPSQQGTPKMIHAGHTMAPSAHCGEAGQIVALEEEGDACLDVLWQCRQAHCLTGRHVLATGSHVLASGSHVLAKV